MTDDYFYIGDRMMRRTWWIKIFIPIANFIGLIAIPVWALPYVAYKLLEEGYFKSEFFNRGFWE